ncbi:MAG TPA: hypothetical protein PKA28_06710 [Methylomusa anaerophila]|uniref:Uncharacterized protein n=1 Tax=Methylomusa anaerophila TaxID=1930071 RepID=A0A348AGF0_9FIRM|nr:hypothetical protein [Methylomusa anaerophila]BBB90148.1 hypothetical protein MAMMFC1_00796 [Methylomusa anaerophila]HML88127.1 hypothetical protein [Methylomusa anaerophila]
MPNKNCKNEQHCDERDRKSVEFARELIEKKNERHRDPDLPEYCPVQFPDDDKNKR